MLSGLVYFTPGRSRAVVTGPSCSSKGELQAWGGPVVAFHGRSIRQMFFGEQKKGEERREGEGRLQVEAKKSQTNNHVSTCHVCCSLEGKKEGRGGSKGW